MPGEPAPNSINSFKVTVLVNFERIYTSYWVTLINNDPLFNSIRNEPEFQKIVKNVESKYQAEHERVRKWLEEQGKL